MGRPSETEETDEVNQNVAVIKEEHDDGSDNPENAVLEKTQKGESSWQIQIDPSVKNKQSKDVSLEKEPGEVEAVDTEGEQRHSSQDGLQEDYSYGGEKLLRGNVSDAFDSGENSGPESVKEKQETSIASRNGVEKAPVHIADGNKTGGEFTDASKTITSTSPIQPVNTGNFKKDQLTQANSLSFILKTKKIKGKFSANRPRRKAIVNANLGDFGFVRFSGCLFLISSLCLVASMDDCSIYEPGCSVSGSKRGDRVLDALDVLDSLDVKSGLERRVFNGSGRGYNQICSTAFQDVNINEVDLSKNSLFTLPSDIFHHTGPLERLDLSVNNFVEFPGALNSSNHIQFLSLSKNRIEDIPVATMNGMTSLSVFDLSNNEVMKQVPEDVFSLMEYSLRSVILHLTHVKHPLVPPPHNKVCTKDNPCIVTHKEGFVSIEINGSKLAFHMETMACEGVKQQLEADYEVLEGEVRCDNNTWNGTIKIVRKDVSDAGTTYEPSQPDLTTITDTVTDLGKTEVPTTGIDQDTVVDTTLSTVEGQHDLTNVHTTHTITDQGTAEVPTRGSGQCTCGHTSVSTVLIIIVIVCVLVTVVCLGAVVKLCYDNRASKKTVPFANGPVGGKCSCQHQEESSTSQNSAESQV